MSSQENSKIGIRTPDAMLRGLQKIRTTMHELTNDQFIRCCREWMAHRRKTLSVLNELQRELDSVHTNSSVARVVGTGVGVLGGLAAIIGFGLRLGGDPEMKELADGLMKYGGGAGAIGGVAAGAVDVAESMLNRKIIAKVQEAIKDDEMYSQTFLPWFQRSQELEELFQNVFGCSIMSNSTNDILEVVKESKVICDRGGRFLINVMNTLSDVGEKIFDRRSNRKNMKSLLMTANDKTKLLLEQFCSDQRVREAVWSICEFAIKSPVTLKIVKAGLKVSFKMNSQNAVISMIIPSAGRALLQNASKITNGLFLAITLAINVAALISAAKDVHKGKSKYTKMLNDVKKCLTCELNFLLEEYPVLRSIENA